jgi:hypothetical protein
VKENPAVYTFAGSAGNAAYFALRKPLLPPGLNSVFHIYRLEGLR